MPTQSTKRKAGWIKGVQRRTPTNVQQEFKDAAEIVAKSPPFGVIPIGVVVERALILLFEDMPPSMAKTRALAMIRGVRAYSEADPSEPIQSPSVPRGGNGTQPSTTPGI